MRKIYVLGRDDDDAIDKCRNFMHKYCHPVQIGTGLIFSTIGVGVTAAGILYADGLSFLIHSIPQIPEHIINGNLTSSVDYLRESYRSSMSEAIGIGWRQVPFSYCIGHYVGGKLREKLTAPFRRR